MRFIITQNEPLAPSTYLMRLAGDTRAITRPGQFVQLAVPDFYLRRPISVCDWRPVENGMLDLIYKVVGHGTAAMAGMQPGDALDLLTGLGNGFDIDERDEVTASESPLLLGGGTGVPPLYALAKSLLARLKKPTVVLGFNTAEEVFYRREFEALGVPTIVTTANGGAGVKGFVTDAMRSLGGKYDYVYACGPEPMLRAVYDLCEQSGVSGQFSFESRMACGFGVCMGCSCKTKYGSKRICKDGPVLFREEIVW